MKRIIFIFLFTIFFVGSAFAKTAEISSTTVMHESSPFVPEEIMPTFQGGDLNTFLDWVESNIVYPQNVKKSDIKGIVIKFSVDADGNVIDIKSVSSPDNVMTEEVIRVVKMSPKWSPAKQNGQAVKFTFYNTPVKLKLPKRK
jgi:protein TonB